MRKVIEMLCLLLLMVACAKREVEHPIGIWEGKTILGPTRFHFYLGRAEVVSGHTIIHFRCVIRDRSVYCLSKGIPECEIDIGRIEAGGSLLLFWIPDTIDDSYQGPYRLRRIPNQPLQPTTMSVTDRAAARSAPATVVADL